MNIDGKKAEFNSNNNQIGDIKMLLSSYRTQFFHFSRSLRLFDTLQIERFCDMHVKTCNKCRADPQHKFFSSFFHL